MFGNNYLGQAYMAYGGRGCLGSGYSPFMMNQLSPMGAFSLSFSQGLFQMVNNGIQDREEDRAAKKAEKQAAKQAVEDGVKDLETKKSDYDKLVAKSNKDIEDETIKANPSLDENIKTAENKISDIDNGKDTHSVQIKGLQDKNEDLNQKREAATKQEDKDEIDKQIETNKEKIRELEAQKTKARSVAVQEKETAEKARTKAIEKAQEDHGTAVAAKKKELEKAQGQVEEDVSKVHKVSKKCDDNDELKGIILKDGSEKDVNSELNDKDLNNVEKNNAKNYARAFNYQFSQYCNEKDNNKKKTLAANAKLVYNKLKDFEDKNDKKGKYITPEMEQNMKILESGQRTFGL